MDETKSKNQNKRILYVIVGVLVLASIGFRLINKYNLEQTSILFIGLPTLITLLVIKFSKTPKSTYGIVFRVITIFLLMSSILFGEGTVCILMSAPIFYGLAALLVFVYQYLKKKDKEKYLSIYVIPILLVLAVPMKNSEVSKIHSVETISSVSNEAKLDWFNNDPILNENYPKFFKLGFPKPVNISGEGTSVGDKRHIQFLSNTKGIGTLSLEIESRDENSIVFKIIEDNTHIEHWLSWNKIKVDLINTSATETQIKWTSEFECKLSPAWYFEPLEKYTVQIMNQHLIDVYFN